MITRLLKNLQNHKTKEKKKKTALTSENTLRLLREKQKVFNVIENELSKKNKKQKNNNKQTPGKVFPLDLAHVAPITDSKHLKVLTPKQILQRLAIALAQVKSAKTSENFLNEISRIIYSLYRAK